MKYVMYSDMEQAHILDGRTTVCGIPLYEDARIGDGGSVGGLIPLCDKCYHQQGAK